MTYQNIKSKLFDALLLSLFSFAFISLQYYIACQVVGIKTTEDFKYAFSKPAIQIAQNQAGESQ